MILSILDFISDIGDIISYIAKGIRQIFDFLLNIPNFINSLINIIPSPFKEVFLAFSGLIIIYFICKAVMSLVS